MVWLLALPLHTSHLELQVNIVPPMAAIANAIDHAIGRRLTELPMSPPRSVAALAAGHADD